MITDEQLIDLIRDAGHRGPDVLISPAAVRDAARRRTRRTTVLVSAFISVTVAAAVLLSGSSTPTLHHRVAALPTPSAIIPRPTSATAGPVEGLGPGCGPGFGTRVVGGYNENGTLATVAAGKPVTINVVLTVQRPTYLKTLSLVVGPHSIGTDPFPALRTEQMFTGQAVAGQHVSATVTISAPGSYAVLIYGVSTSTGPCGGITSSGPETSSQPIGYLRVH